MHKSNQNAQTPEIIILVVDGVVTDIASDITLNTTIINADSDGYLDEDEVTHSYNGKEASVIVNRINPEPGQLEHLKSNLEKKEAE